MIDYNYFLACNIMKKLDINDCSFGHFSSVATLPCKIQNL